jgi:hypothetical protein
MLELEREAFVSLCGEPKSQERMQYMLMNNKPLRNCKEKPPMTDIVIADAVRSAVGRAHKGSLALTRPDELAGRSSRALLARVPQVKPADVEDLVLGCAMPEGEQGLNVARVAGLLGGLPDRDGRDDHQPLLLERPAGHRARGGRHRHRARTTWSSRAASSR